MSLIPPDNASGTEAVFSALIEVNVARSIASVTVID